MQERIGKLLDDNFNHDLDTTGRANLIENVIENYCLEDISDSDLVHLIDNELFTKALHEGKVF